MLVAVVGGSLQGVEATYLAHKAGWEVMVIDKKTGAPAIGLADHCFQLDVTEENELCRALKGVDFVIPALEEDDALNALTRLAAGTGIPFAYDPSAYAISSSKEKSNRLFAQMGLPTPKSWPESGFPVVAKPNKGSGSKGVRLLHDADELKSLLSGTVTSTEWVLQEFVSGPSYSIEVIGLPGAYRALQVTDLSMDAAYDCKRVAAPTELPPDMVAQFEDISVAIAECLGLRGLMDVEVILHDDIIKILEVDARLPSQTPTAVYWSTGQNMVEMLASLFLDHPNPRYASKFQSRSVVYEHIKVSQHLLEVSGEHIMTTGGPLYLIQDFYGAEEAITNYKPGLEEWAATIIITGPDRQSAWARRARVVKELQKRFALWEYSDPEPDNHEWTPNDDQTANR